MAGHPAFTVMPDWQMPLTGSGMPLFARVSLRSTRFKPLKQRRLKTRKTDLSVRLNHERFRNGHIVMPDWKCP